MILLLQSAAPASIKPFADYCLQRGWRVRLDISDEHHCDFYVVADDASLVQAEFTRYIQAPHHARYQAAAWERAETGLMYGKGSTSRLLASVWQQTGWLSWCLGGVCVLVYVALLLWPEQTFQQLMFFTQWPDATDWLSWRWFSPALLHFSAAHLWMNLLVLLTFGGMVERRQGTWTLFVIAICSAGISNSLQFAFSGPWFGGLSGVAYALVGFYFMMGRRAPEFGYRLGGANLVLAVMFMLLGFADMLWVKTANWAHVAGLLLGVVLAVLWPHKTAPATY